MAAMTDLDQMLRQLSVKRKPGEFVFVTVSSWEAASSLRPAATVSEDESITAVIPKEQADALGLPYDYVAAWLTLEINSALNAVGLTAAFSRVLGDAGISCNVLAGVHHDHLLVAADDADRAIRVLLTLRPTPGISG